MSEETKEYVNKTNYFWKYAVHMVLTAVFAAGVAWFSNEVILENARKISEKIQEKQKITPFAL